MGEACSTYGGSENMYEVFVGKSEGHRPVGRCRRGWEGNIKMYFSEVKLKDVDWIHLTEDGAQWLVLLSMIMNFLLP
jgi:hypothetical protein